MAILIATSTQKKVFSKSLITIGSIPDCDFKVNIGKEKLIIQYSVARGKYIVANKFNNPRILFHEVPFSGAILLENAIKFDILDSNDYIIIKVVQLKEDTEAQQVAQQQKQEETPKVEVSTPVYTENEMKNIYGPETQMSVKDKLEKHKAELEEKRAPIIKEVGFAINDIKNRLSLNNKSALFVNIAMFFGSLVSAFGVSNFITGLKIEETANFINLPTNIKILALFTFLLFGLALVLKQAAFLYFQNKKFKEAGSLQSQNFLATVALLFFVGVYVINLIYYLNVNPMFAILMSLFFVGLTVGLALAAGYFKCSGHFLAYELDKYEYREDFEKVLNNYRGWIEKFINSLSANKLENLKDKLFNFQLKSYGEIFLGILTAPFLAYGVSNTLAMCFPEAAGWIRISGLRFSPVFLTLATFMIIFAFFSFVNAFLSVRKIQASQVIKHDGFSDYLKHGVEILGLQAVRKLESEKTRCFIIGCAIIFIEFTMNMSFFAGEIGGDLQGLLLSIIAALVPTALLIAETYMLSQTKFDIAVIEDLMDKKD